MHNVKAIALIGSLLMLAVAGAQAGGTWETKTSTPSPIIGHAVVAANDRLYSVGGATSTACCSVFTAPTFIYDDTTNTWSTGATMTLKRKNLTADAVNGVVYAVGGDNDFIYFATNEAYDPLTNSWTTRQPMPTPRAFPASAVVNGIHYVVGGENFTGVLTTVEAYNPATNSWSTKAPMHNARSRGHAVAAVNQVLYVIGGYDTNTGTALSSVEAYDTTTNTWTNKASLPVAGNAFSAAVVDGRIYVIGGFDNGPASIVRVYDPATDSWGTAEPMPAGRYSSGAGAINGVIYVAGGFTGSPPAITATVEAFTPAATEGDTTPPALSCPPAPVSLSAGSNGQVAVPDVTGLVGATDDVTLPGSLIKSQSPAAGTMIGAGSHDVTVTVADQAGNENHCTVVLTVTVLTPQQAIQLLIGRVNALNHPQGPSLTAKLRAAIQALDGGRANAARGSLQAFINELNAMVRSGRLSSAQAQSLANDANEILALIP